MADSDDGREEPWAQNEPLGCVRWRVRRATSFLPGALLPDRRGRAAATRVVMAGAALVVAVALAAGLGHGGAAARAAAPATGGAAAHDSARLIDGQLLGVSCTSDLTCMAVGAVSYSGVSRSHPLAERWNGKRWTLERTPAPAGVLDAVSCPAARICVAVGIANVRGGAGCIGGYCKFVALAERWNGSWWTIQPVPNPRGTYNTELSSVSCSSTKRCTAVGSYAVPGGTKVLIERWNGRRWMIASPATGIAIGELSDVSCTSANSCIAVGSSGTAGVSRPLAERWNGRRWAVLPTTSPRGFIDNFLIGISCSSPTVCTALGSGGPFGEPKPLHPFADRWNGARWTLQPAAQPATATTALLGRVSCARAGCTAVGSYARGQLPPTRFQLLAERSSGRRWTTQRTANPPSLTSSELMGVFCTSDEACIAVGYYTTGKGFTHPLAERWNGRWTFQPSASDAVP